MTQKHTPTVFVDIACELGEGPHISNELQRLYWVDIVARQIHSISLKGESHDIVTLPDLIGAAVPCKQGGLLAATHTGLYLINAESPNQLLCHPEADRPDNRYNDGKCDSRGRFWVGSLSTSGENAAGRLWKIEADGTFELMAVDLSISNGLGWSPDDTYFYLTDSHTQSIYRYDFDAAAGTLHNRCVLIKFDSAEGTPDGLCVDEQGFLWCAMWDGAQVVRVSPEGNIGQRIPMPVERPTSCALGTLPMMHAFKNDPLELPDSDNSNTLFVTSARVGLSSQALHHAPQSGSIFAVPVNVQGLEENRFG